MIIIKITSKRGGDRGVLVLTAGGCFQTLGLFVSDGLEMIFSGGRGGGLGFPVRLVQKWTDKGNSTVRSTRRSIARVGFFLGTFIMGRALHACNRTP